MCLFQVTGSCVHVYVILDLHCVALGRAHGRAHGRAQCPMVGLSGPW